MKAINKITEPESHETPVCFVSDKCDVKLRQSVHKKVCLKLKLTEHINGQFYCLFHLPTEEKNVDRFNKIFQSRIKEIDNKISNIENKFPSDEVKQNEEFDKFDYDFRYVYFPTEIDFINRKFRVDVDFSHAIFKCKVDFTKTAFLAKTFFISTYFSANSDFSEAMFSSDAHFSNTIFDKESTFNSTEFSSDSDFNNSVFTGDANFGKTTFKADTNFYKVTFSATSDFSEATFTGNAYFSNTIFKAKGNFHSGTFKALTDFSSSTFWDKANFESRIFESEVDFKLATFLAYTDFSSSTFWDKANFERGTFESKVDFKSTTFLAYTVFSSATFSAEVDFSEAIFSPYTDFITTTDFISTVFLAKANFYFGTFSAPVNFESATFSADTVFTSAMFSADAKFRSSTFKARTFFRNATFTDAVDFNEAKLNETSQTYFYKTRFCKNIWFSKAEVEGFVEFEENVFLDSSNVQEVKRELKEDFINLNEKLYERGIEYSIPTYYITEDQVAVFEFGDSKLRNPERISFYSLRLRPSWFVNVDETHKLAFNDVEWINTEIDTDRKGLDDEIQNLKTRNITRERSSFDKACNQLADNAEANRRFEEAKQFNKLIIALKDRKCHIHDAVQSHKKDDIRKSVCGGYPVVNEDGGNYYCLWHNPNKNKAEVFLNEFNKRQEVHSKAVESETNEIGESSDFRSVFFPITVEYNGNLPSSLDFTGATFQRRVVFEKAKIHSLNFNEAYFEEGSELVFKDSECDGKINLDKAVFAGKFFLHGNQNHLFFKKSKEALTLKNARFAKPDWVNFRSLILRPHYFLEADPSKFNFHDCKWSENKNQTVAIANELKDYQKKELAKVYNQIAVNYEENREFEESSAFRYAAMETKCLDNAGWRKVLNLYWFYKQTSEYGESWIRAIYWLILIWIYFALVYWSFGQFQNNESVGFLHSFGYSLQVMTLQKPDPRPLGWFTVLYYGFETILAPFQAALLALAIRRKFMR